MNLITVKDFGIALNISGGTIRSKKSRGQLRCNKQGFIDINDSVNFAYIIEVNGGDLSVFDAYLIKPSLKSKVVKKTNVATKSKTIVGNKKKDNISVEKTENAENEKPSVDGGSVKVASSVEPTKKVIENKLTAAEKKAISAREEYNKSLLDLDLRSKIAKVKREERESELKLIELEKKTGNIVPLDKVISLMSINTKSIFTAFQAQLKNIAVTVVSELGGTSEDVNKILRMLEFSVSDIKKTSQENAEIEVKLLVEDFSGTNLTAKNN